MFNFSNILESIAFSAPPRARTPSDYLHEELPAEGIAMYTVGELFGTMMGGLPIFNNDPPENDQFWDSVKVTTPIDKIPTAVVDNYECPICGNEEREILKLPCCKGRLCKKCGINWFEKESSNCMFCKKDLREC
jgi:hypothetical protein